MDTVGLLERLVACPTVSSASNLDLIGFVQAILSDAGIDSRLIHDSTGRKANLLATVGPPDKPGVLLSGHTDVVPVEGQAWAGDPFRLSSRDGRLYGRGAADMKGFLACALRAARLAARRKLASPLRLAFSYDEEVGCIGVRSLIDDLAGRRDRPSLVIVGEPTSMAVATGHKGKIALRATCCGREAHSALAPTGLNAIHLAVDFIGCLRDRQTQIERAGCRDDAYAVPYSTIHVGMIRGGTALNIVPSRCTLDFEIRNIACDDPMRILADIRDDAAGIAARQRGAFGEADVRVEIVGDYPGLDPAGSRDTRSFIDGLLDGPSLTKVDFGTEAGLFQEKLAVPVCVCGPGSMDQGHKADEFVTVDQLQLCDRMMDRLLDRLSS